MIPLDEASSCAPGDSVVLELSAHPQNVVLARRAAVSLAQRHGADATRRGEIALAVSEACSNVVMHAFAGVRPGLMRLQACVEDDSLRVTVADDGAGLAPRTDSPGVGLGLPLIATLCSSFEVRQTAGSGTEVRMRFALRSA